MPMLLRVLEILEAPGQIIHVEEITHPRYRSIKTTKMSYYCVQCDRQLYITENASYLNILAMSDDKVKYQFRFTIGIKKLLVYYLKIPVTIWTTEEVRSIAIAALVVSLCRLTYPKRWIDMLSMFSRAPSTLYHIFYYIVELLDNNLASFLFLDTTRITKNMSRHDPGSIEEVWEFIDGTIRPICRLCLGQQAVYNGHKRARALKFQTVVTLDGIISHNFGPVDSRRHELTKGTPAFHNKLIYEDPAYRWTNVFCGPYKGCRMNIPQKELNEATS
ncbi:hypothetical protein PHMEG_00010930 [Phytophthora megakarya]|uniref:DDE Tnp4 domain-containing protein n=1 Tax=Phytophthora megakarya TaxID=4795 RepID=A0A225WEH0_9STRA|nr:hypothetical protein PHMEG_00010930 [Phytophthora megakarya]